MKKKCNKCQKKKDVSEFHKESRALNGFKPRCRDCTNSYYNSMYPGFRKNKLIHAKAYYLSNIDTKREYGRSRKHPDPERRRRLAKARRKINRIKVREYWSKYTKKRILSDPEFRLARRMRSWIHRTLKKKNNRTSILLGYSSVDLINKLGRVPGRREVVDHKIPITWFNSGTEVRIINHLENLQILTKKENAKKLNLFSHPISFDYYLLASGSVKTKYINKINHTK